MTTLGRDCTTAPPACQGRTETPDGRQAVPVFHAGPLVLTALRGALPEVPSRAYALRRVNPDESDGPLLCDRDGLPDLHMTEVEALAAMADYPHLRLKVVPAPRGGRS